jgi:small-conductance mechanosensitive channel
MQNPWLTWWEDLTSWWGLWRSPEVLGQFAALGTVLVVALILERLLERRRARWLGDAPLEQRKIRTVLWAAKYPFLVLVLGALALAVFSAAGWPVRTLQRLVSLFWYVVTFALVAEGLRVFVPPGDARRVIRKVLLPLLALVGVLHLTGLLAVIWEWAGQPIVTLTSGRITLASIGLALGIIIAFWLAAKTGKSLFLQRILPRTETDPELAHSVSTFIQFAIIVAGFWIAISTMGIEFSNLTLLISALTVGIGFGLQDVIKNVMGGMILLGEGHVRPNEVFQIAGETGEVERIGIRSTTLRTWDGAQVIVPNALLIAEKVTDLTDSQRVEVSVGISCDADPRLAERLLLEIAAAHADVLDDPPPSVLFTNLGSSTFDFVLYCFVEARDKILRTKSDLHYAVVETFRQHNLEMPYPQRDIHLRSGPWKRVLSPSVAELDPGGHGNVHGQDLSTT